MPKKLSPDKTLFAVTVVLVLFGVVMVNSASAILKGQQTGGLSMFFLRQSAVAIGSLILMWIVMRIDYKRYDRVWVVVSGLVLCSAMLIAVLLQKGDSSVHRWLQWGAVSFQPSEPTKLCVILFVAGFLARQEREINRIVVGLLPIMLVLGWFACLILAEPDLGTAASLMLVVMILLFASGLWWRRLFGLLGAALGVLIIMVLSNPYQWRRLVIFFSKGSDPLGADYQITQSLIALGSGGAAGLGLGNGMQKLFFLPQPHSDFIFSVIGEELGLLGTILVTFLFMIFFLRGIKAAVRAPDRFGYFLALGLTLLIVIQSYINISVVLNLLPTKGIPLPFISVGGSSLLVSLVAAGILLNISQYGERPALAGPSTEVTSLTDDTRPAGRTG